MSLRAKDLAGKIICCGVGSIVSIQSFINICVATGLAPNTGTPLPFVSYGLTSLISLFIGMGLVLNVGLQSSAYNKELQKKEQKKDACERISAEGEAASGEAGQSRGVVRAPRRSHLPAVRAVSGIYEGVPNTAKNSRRALRNEKSPPFQGKRRGSNEKHEVNTEKW